MSNFQERVYPPLDPVLQSICHLHVVRSRGLNMLGLTKWGPNYSSGVLYKGRYVITAAHNVHSTGLTKVRSIEVSVGQAIVDGQQTVGVAGYRTAAGFRWKKYSRDFAVIKLVDAVEVPEPFSLRPIDLAADAQRPVHAAGYPGASGGERNSHTLFVGTGTGNFSGHKDLLSYDIDTETGNSGGPVWVEDDDGSPRLIGVHVSAFGRSNGQGRRANQKFVDDIEAMIADLGD